MKRVAAGTRGRPLRAAKPSPPSAEGAPLPEVVAASGAGVEPAPTRVIAKRGSQAQGVPRRVEAMEGGQDTRVLRVAGAPVQTVRRRLPAGKTHVAIPS